MLTQVVDSASIVSALIAMDKKTESYLVEAKREYLSKLNKLAYEHNKGLITESQYFMRHSEFLKEFANQCADILITDTSFGLSN